MMGGKDGVGGAVINESSQFSAGEDEFVLWGQGDDRGRIDSVPALRGID